ncbi:MAG TPA: hypothetical protein VJR47_05475 [Stellaceae bacterium]|nr:hypothetical protein [Stellaceae bacterium]
MSREIIIHSLEHARAALAIAASLDAPLVLASAAGAALQTGPLWFKSVIAQASAAHPDVALTAVLDCGEAPGAVMAGLRAGLKHFRFSGRADIRAKLAAMGAQFAEPPAAALDLRDTREPETAIRAFLARG